MYAGPIGSEVPDYEMIEGTSSKSLIFNVAFGLSDRNDQPEVVEDERFGKLMAVQTYRTANGTLDYRTLKTGPCSEEILADQFFPINQRFEKDAKFNMAKLKCL